MLEAQIDARRESAQPLFEIQEEAEAEEDRLSKQIRRSQAQCSGIVDGLGVVGDDWRQGVGGERPRVPNKDTQCNTHDLYLCMSRLFVAGTGHWEGRASESSRVFQSERAPALVLLPIVNVLDRILELCVNPSALPLMD